MPALTAKEFIKRYSNDPNSALKWLQETEMDLTTLFTQKEDVERLANVYRERVASAIRSEESPIEKFKDVTSPITKLLEKAGAQIAGLYKSAAEFILLADASSSFATTLFNRAPDTIAGLFTSYSEYMALNEELPSLASAVLKHDPNKIYALKAKSVSETVTTSEGIAGLKFFDIKAPIANGTMLDKDRDMSASVSKR